MELDLQSLFGLHVHSCCTHWLRPRPQSPNPPQHSGLYKRAIQVSQDRRHLFVTPPDSDNVNLARRSMIQKILTDLVNDLRQGSSSFFTLKRSWSVPCRQTGGPPFQCMLLQFDLSIYYFLIPQHLPSTLPFQAFLHYMCLPPFISVPFMYSSFSFLPLPAFYPYKESKKPTLDVVIC